jgi:iron complex outermembrane receptor protein
MGAEMFCRKVKLLTGAGLSLFVGEMALAQAAGQSPPTLGQPQVNAIEEIIVTARKRAESLQDVPVAVTALSGDQLQQKNIGNTRDLISIAPGLYFSQSGQRQSEEQYFITLRGVGSSPVVEPSVGVFVDGAYVPSLGWTTDFLDLDRVEVLRGPQGALFGRNTEGGAVNIVSKRPDNTFRGSASAEIAEFGTYKGSFRVSGPLGGNVFAGLAAFASTTDGYVHNATLNADQDDRKRSGGRLTVRYRPTNDDELFGAVDYLIVTGHNNAYGDAVNESYTVVDPTARAARRGTFFIVNPLAGSRYTTYGNSPSPESLVNYGLTLNYTHDFDWATLTSISNGRNVKSYDSYDNDGIATATSTNSATERQTILQQEMRLASRGEGRLKWVTGAYGFDEDVDQKRFSLDSSGILAGPIQNYPLPSGYTQDYADIRRIGYAFFGQGSYEVFTSLEATVGLRYSNEHVQQRPDLAVKVQIPSPAPPGVKPTVVNFDNTTPQSDDFRGLSPSGSLSYKFDAGTLIYGSVATGFKGGGFAREVPNTPAQDLPLKNETSTDYELGLKSEFLQHRVRLNADVFYVDISNQQLSTRTELVPGSGVYVPTTQSVGKSHSQGFEVEGTVIPIAGVRIDASVDYTDAKFDDYLAIPATAGAPAYNRKGQDQPEVPKWTSSLSSSYAWVLPDDLLLTPQITWRYVGSHYTGQGTTSIPFLTIDSYNVLDGQVSLSAGRYNFTLYGKNLTDRYYFVNRFFLQPALSAPGYQSFAKPGAPRQIGFRVTADF